MTPAAVLLDMDGTLVDAFAPIVYALNKTLESFGKPPMSEQDIKRHTGRGECSMISLFGEQREQAVARYLEFHDQRLYDIQPIPGAEPLLHWLQEQGIPAAIVTSKSQSRAERQLQHLGWEHYFTAVIGLTPERRQKPDPHTVFLACEAMGISPDHAIMIGDGTADMKAARAAGCLPIGISQHFSADELVQAGAAHCFPTLQDAHAWLKTATD